MKAGTDIGTRKTFADCGRTITEYLGVPPTAMGESFLGEVSK